MREYFIHSMKKIFFGRCFFIGGEGDMDLFEEYGRIGQNRYGGIFFEEFLTELQGQKGIEIYKEMSENDDIIGAMLFAIEMLMRQATWDVEAAGSTETDKKAAAFVKSCLHHMEQSW